MILTHIMYSNKPMIVLILGNENENLICINDKYINENDAKLIKRNLGKLKNYTIHNKVKWIKENTPTSYNKGFRKLKLNKIKILKSYSLESGKYN